MLSEKPSKTLLVVAAGALLCGILVWAGLAFPHLLTDSGISSDFPFSGLQGEKSRPVHPFIELLKLVVAAAIGIIVTSVHKHCRRDEPMSRSVEQSLMLLCVAGAMMMLIIGSSLPRALGIAGGAGIIRFRTPMKDPKDAAVFILLLGLGMASGAGAFAVAGLGAMFVVTFLLILDRFGDPKKRKMLVQMVASVQPFPTEHVQHVFSQYKLRLEPREINPTSVKYQVAIGPEISLDDITNQLMSANCGLKSVVWESAKKKK